jgi:hypothetical protein
MKGNAMADDDERPRHASEISEAELEEIIVDVLKSALRSDIAERALAWLETRKDAYARLHGTLQ